jgi:hypothetical protein
MLIPPLTAQLFDFEPCWFVTFSGAYDHVAEIRVSPVSRRRSCPLETPWFLCLLPSASDG